MRRLVFGTVSALLLTGTVIPTLVATAHAQMTASVKASAPFIVDAGLDRSIGDRHFITVAVTGFSLEQLLITLPDDMRTLEAAKVTNQMGKEVEANVAISKGMVTINFPKPVAPNEFLKVTLSGVKMDHQGGTALYRVSAIQTGLVGTIPIGTAMVRLLDSSS